MVVFWAAFTIIPLTLASKPLIIFYDHHQSIAVFYTLKWAPFIVFTNEEDEDDDELKCHPSAVNQALQSPDWRVVTEPACLPYPAGFNLLKWRKDLTNNTWDGHELLQLQEIA